MVVTRSVASRRFVWISDGVVEYGLYFLIIFTPFAFGTVEPWSIAIAEVVIFTMALAWGFTMVGRGEIRIEKTPFNLCWLLVLGFGLLQIVPLPLQVIRVLSPKAYALYRDMAFDSGLNASWHTSPSTRMRRSKNSCAYSPSRSSSGSWQTISEHESRWTGSSGSS